MSEVALNGMTIQLRLQAPHDLVFSVGIDKDFAIDNINQVMDMLTAVADREKLKGQLAELQRQLQSNIERVQTRSFERDIAALRRQRAEFDMLRNVTHIDRGRRGEAPKVTAADKTKYAEFDRQIQVLEKARDDVKAGIPITQYQIDCVYARISGQPVPEMPEEVRRLVQSLDLPEDVSIAA